MSAAGNLILLDGMALAYRGHFALMQNPRLTSKGENTSAAFVFMGVLMDLMKTADTTHIAVAFDTKEPTHRHLEYVEYKAHREEMPEDLAKNLPWIFRICEAFKLPVLRYPGWEADDVIGTLARRAEAAGLDTRIVTPDKDFAQLVSPLIHLRKPAKFGGGFDEFGEEAIKKDWAVERPAQVIDLLALMGDASDNVPGVPGIGLKTAQKLIATYGSVENLLDHVGDLKGKQKENIANNRDMAILSKRLVTIRTDVPVTVGVDDLVRVENDDDALKLLCAELEFRTYAKKLFGANFERELEAAQDAVRRATLASAADVFHDYKIAATAEERAALLAKILAQPRVAYDSETTGLDPRTCDLVGFSVSWAEHAGWYVPLPANREEYLKVLAEFAPFWNNEKIEKIGHNLHFDLSVLAWHGISVAGPFFDTLLAAFLTMPERRRTMDALAGQLLGYRPIPITDLIGPEGAEQRSMRDVPLDRIAEYAAEDADITFQLAAALRPLLVESNQDTCFRTVECPLIPVLVAMEREGIAIDPDSFVSLKTELQVLIDRSAQAVEDLSGQKINLGSPKQVGVLLFETLGLGDEERVRMTKTGQYATDEETLSRLAERHPVAQRILDHRLTTKLQSTYVETLPAAVLPQTGRIHTTYDQAVAATGRLSSNAPNLQNIPIRSDLGREVRRCFVPRGFPREKGWQLLSADYSQIELRIAASLSGDEAMIAAFNSGIDFHTATAMRISDIANADLVSDEMRRQAKMVNFGILYGISAFGLSERSGMSRSDGQRLIDSYFAGFPGLKNWIEQTTANVHRDGFVTTMTGRRRYIRDIHSGNATTRKGAERVAVNAPIQGSAADMIKLAMIAVHAEIRKRGLKSRLLLQVHDELVFDMPVEEKEVLKPLVEDLMKNALPLKVPLVVDIGIGDNWLDAH